MTPSHASTVLLISSFLGSAIFMTRFHLKTYWWRSHHGVWMMVFVAGEALWVGAVLLSMWYKWNPWVSISTYALVPVSIWWRVVLFDRIQKHGASRSKRFGSEA